MADEPNSHGSNTKTCYNRIIATYTKNMYSIYHVWTT